MNNFDFNGEGEMLLVDKPLDWTSFDVVNKIKSLFHIKRVGHAGTLDPKATGLLIVCTGKKTKSIDQFVADEKEYTGMMELGVRTPSFDSETEVTERRDTSSVTEQDVRNVVMGFAGVQQQLPPMYSALKFGGKALYTYARKGRTMPRALREIEIHDIELTAWEPPFVRLRVVCSKGTYIRTLVSDIGDKLGCGAVLRELRRTRIGRYSVADAKSIEDLKQLQRSFSTQGSVLHDHRPLALGSLA